MSILRNGTGTSNYMQKKYTLIPSTHHLQKLTWNGNNLSVSEIMKLPKDIEEISVTFRESKISYRRHKEHKLGKTDKLKYTKIKCLALS